MRTILNHLNKIRNQRKDFVNTSHLSIVQSAPECQHEFHWFGDQVKSRRCLHCDVLESNLKEKSAPVSTELEHSLQNRFSVTPEQMREQIKPLFLFMFDHGITTLTIDRDDKKCLLTVDGKQL